MTAILPPPLGPRSRIALIAPAGAVPRGAVNPCLARLEERYEVAHDRGLTRSNGYLAGDDERRRAELQAAFDDPEVGAVIAMRGGFGTTRILDEIDFSGLLEAPKWIVGSSDLTALLAQLWADHRLAGIHGPMGVGIARDESTDDFELLASLLEGIGGPPCEGLAPMVPGYARGPLLGGNLTILAHLCGVIAPSFTSGGILFLEDVGERPYRLDRCLVQLRRSGVFDDVRGIVLGEFTNCDPGPDGDTIEDVIERNISALGVPVASGYPAAHGIRNRPFVHGAEVELDIGDGGATLTPLA